ncbi:MAG: hypothetical protein HYW77_01000 [Parcubacteria group bacterium]|nr:hypothetical protein [Parcubacteria group bacterium]
MKFKDLKKGDKFIRKCSVEALLEGTQSEVVVYTKVRLAGATDVPNWIQKSTVINHLGELLGFYNEDEEVLKLLVD